MAFAVCLSVCLSVYVCVRGLLCGRTIYIYVCVRRAPWAAGKDPKNMQHLRGRRAKLAA